MSEVLAELRKNGSSGGSTEINVEAANTQATPSSNEVTAIAGEYYIGYGGYGGKEWRCANGEILYQVLDPTYGANFALVKATANGNLGLNYRYGNNNVWVIPPIVHLVTS